MRGTKFVWKAVLYHTLWCQWDLRCFGMFCSVDWYLPRFRDNLYFPASRVRL